eukprot:269262-Pleurochrysis_carterae.AAC.2
MEMSRAHPLSHISSAVPSSLPFQAVKLLAEQHRLLVLPGSAFGASGALRLSYGGQSSVAAAKEVAERIREAAATLSRHARP